MKLNKNNNNSMINDMINVPSNHSFILKNLGELEEKGVYEVRTRLLNGVSVSNTYIEH